MYGVMMTAEDEYYMHSTTGGLGQMLARIVCCPFPVSSSSFATTTTTTTLPPSQVLQVTRCEESSSWSNDYSCVNAYTGNPNGWATANQGV